MTRLGKSRLWRVVRFLRRLPRDRFRFGILTNSCHSVGCAVGWLPSVFPTLARYGRREKNEQGVIINGARQSGSSITDATKSLFELPFYCRFLFIPLAQYRISKDLPMVSSMGTPKQVASLLEKFIRLTEIPK